LINLKTHGQWSRAPLGALLQARDIKDDSVLIGLRCEMKLQNVPHPAFLVLEGPKRGELLESGAIFDSVFDVTSLLEISVVDLKLGALPKNVADTYGTVCEYQAGSGHFLVRAKTGGGVKGFVWLSDPSGKEPTGTVITESLPTMTDLLTIGRTETSEKRHAAP
jgi:hypothetical protein